MKKILLAAILMVLMSSAALAMEKPRVFVMDTEIPNIINEQTNTLIDFSERWELNDLIISALFDYGRFNIYSLDESNEQALASQGLKNFIAERNIQYLVCPGVISVNTREKTLDNGLKIYKLRFVLKMSMLDAVTREALYSVQSEGKVTSEGIAPQKSIKFIYAIEEAVDKAAYELTTNFDSRVKKGE